MFFFLFFLFFPLFLLNMPFSLPFLSLLYIEPSEERLVTYLRQTKDVFLLSE